jgi:hypothetical protein
MSEVGAVLTSVFSGALKQLGDHLEKKEELAEKINLLKIKQQLDIEDEKRKETAPTGTHKNLALLLGLSPEEVRSGLVEENQAAKAGISNKRPMTRLLRDLILRQSQGATRGQMRDQELLNLFKDVPPAPNRNPGSLNNVFKPTGNPESNYDIYLDFLHSQIK